MRDFIKEFQEAVKKVLNEDDNVYISDAQKIAALEERLKEAEEIIKAREEDIKVLQIQKDDKKNNLINTLEEKLDIRYRDFMNFRNIKELDTKSEALEITLEKVFDILMDNGINFKLK